MRTTKELYSLIDFRGGDPSSYSGGSTSGLVPFIDTDYFAYGDESVDERITDRATSLMWAQDDSGAG